MQLKPIFLFTFLFIFVVSQIGCGVVGSIGKPPTEESAVSSVINGYYSAYNSQSFDKCLNYISSSAIKNLGANGIVQATSTRYALGGSVDCQIRSVTVSGNTATVSIYEKFSKTFMATSADVVDGLLVKENGQWKLSWQIPGVLVRP
jgi:hypothetical protein